VCTIIVQSATLSQPAQTLVQIVTPTQTPTITANTKKSPSLASLARSLPMVTTSRSEILKTRPSCRGDRSQKNANVLVPRTHHSPKDFVVAARPQCLLYGPRIYIHYRPKIFLQYLASSVPYVRISTIKWVTYVTFTKYYRSVFVFERVSIYVRINERLLRSEFI
jgi:hypothetical protein